MAKTDYLLITCEHGGNRIPPRYRPLFHDHLAALQTHRGYDAGALTLARELARALDARLRVSATSRLLVDLNRSIGHPRLYSEATRQASVELRREILQRYYLPYRNQAEADIAHAIADGGRVIHIASHSFTPELDGEVRSADIGLLYDPARPGEAELCGRWQSCLKALAPGLKVRRNYPYTGKSDGFTAYLRRRFAPDAYVGIELEINQKHVYKGGSDWRRLRETVIESLRLALPEAMADGQRALARAVSAAPVPV
jgi:predicted N-formylglutamate amidohydrolase